MKRDRRNVMWRMLGASILVLTLMGAATASPIAHAVPGRWSYPRPSGNGTLVKSGSVDWSKLPVTPGHTPTASLRDLPLNRDALTPAQRRAFNSVLTHARLSQPTTVATAPRTMTNASTPNPNYDACGYSDTPCLVYSHAGLTSVQSGGYYPPDQAIASNPSYVLEGVNNEFVAYTFSGGVVGNPVYSFMFFNSILTNGDSLGAPQMFWDATRLHWVIVENEFHTNASSMVDAGYYDVAVSKSQNVTLNPATQYDLYKFSTDFGVGATGHNWCDYPTLGSDFWGLWLDCTAYDTTSDAFQGNGVLALSKNDLYSGAATVYSVVYTQIALTLHVSSTYAYRLSSAVEDGTPDAEFLISTDAGLGAVNDQSLGVCAFTNTRALATHGTLGASCLDQDVMPTGYTDPADASQPGAANSLYPGVGTKMVEYKNGALYFAMTTANASAFDGIYWAEVQPQLSPLDPAHPQNQTFEGTTVRQNGIFVFGNADAYMPTLEASSEDDDTLVVNYSSATINPSIAYMGRRATDALNLLPGSDFGSSTPAVVVGTNPNGSGSWGSYSACSLDTNLTARGLVWCGGEYGGPDASATGTGWDTWIYAMRTE